MALSSPGVQVSVIDESQYLPAPTSSIPLVLLATAENKADPTSSRVAAGTTAANAGKLFRVTSQRDLVTLYGNPFFYKGSDGTPLQGNELNEYGLLAAFSALGVSNSVLCLRADVDLDSLVGQTGRPTGNPEDGSYWLDTAETTWGIHEFNAVTGKFVLQDPIVITSEDSLTQDGAPLQSVGSIGEYAVNANPTYDAPSFASAKRFFYKGLNNQWLPLGSNEWRDALPTVVGTEANPDIEVGDEITFDFQPFNPGLSAFTVTVGAGRDNVFDLAADINDENITGVRTEVVDGRLAIFFSASIDDTSPNTTRLNITGTGSLLEDLGIESRTYLPPVLFKGTAAQRPLWTSGQAAARPTGSVWVRIGSETGFNPVLSVWDDLASVWVPKEVKAYTSDQNAIFNLDSAGGKNIPAGTVYAQYGFSGRYLRGPVYYWERIAEGPTVVTGINNSPEFDDGPYAIDVFVSGPGQEIVPIGSRRVFIADGADANDFVTAWSAANIPFTTASVTSEGTIQITHTEGGVIILNDFLQEDGNGGFVPGPSNGALAEAGFVIGSTPGAKEGRVFSTFADPFQPTQESTSGVGTGLQINAINSFQDYFVGITSIVDGGSGHDVGDIVTFSGEDLGGTSPANDLQVRVLSVDGAGAVTGISYHSGVGASNFSVQLTNWREIDIEASSSRPRVAPADNTNWFFSVVDQVDIMVNTPSGWTGYRNSSYDSNGFPIAGANNTDPNGPIVSPSMPTSQSGGGDLEWGDIWIGTDDLENYPKIYRYQNVDGEDQWVLLDNTNSEDPEGVLFADARWAENGTTNPSTDPIPEIRNLLENDYVDVDAPSPSLYPVGMLLFNTRRSGYNVKQYRRNYFNVNRFPEATLPAVKDAWVSVSGLKSNGEPFMGRKAQRAMVVRAMREAIDTNTAIRDEDNFFNLIAAPNYPELQPNMIALNSDRGETAFIIGDTPMRLSDDATSIQAWATNEARATSTGEDGLVTRNTYLGLFYPSGIASDLSGDLVAVPASHMMIRTMLRNDTVSFPWLAPAGTRRGLIDNAANIGYVDARTGEFVASRVATGVRDTLYTNQINPLVFFTGQGLLNFGNKASFDSQSALDRINVARLVAFIRRQLQLAARPFIFEPNDAYTREQISSLIESLFADLVAKRGLFDYLVVCDESNNTPARIDRNELYVDIAIEPVKAVEFIFIPVRIFNTGQLSGN